MALWLPPAVRAQDHVDRIEGWVRDFDRALKNIDPALSLVFLDDTSEPIYGIVPGRWHVRYRREDAINYMPIVDAQGGYMEPHYGVLDQVRANDLSKNENFLRVSRANDRKRREMEKRQAIQKEERIEELSGRIKSKLNPGVLFGDTKWQYRKERSV